MDNNGESGVPAQASSLTRDTDFYFDDGNLVLQVGRTLFNLHRSRLIRLSECFRGMLQIPPKEAAQEGSCDERPLVIQEDTDMFTNLLCATHQIPSEYLSGLAQDGPVVKCSKLLDLAHLANKYAFDKGLDLWAIDQIDLLFFLTTPFFIDAKMVERLLVVSRNCGDKAHAKICSRVTQAILGKEVDVAAAFDVAVRIGAKTVTAYAGLAILSRQDWATLPLSERQLLQLLLGYRTLSEEWRQMCLVPLKYTHCPSCRDTRSCEVYWTAKWRDVSRATAFPTDMSYVDILGKLGCMADALRQIYPNVFQTPNQNRPLFHPQAPTCLTTSGLDVLLEHFKKSFYSRSPAFFELPSHLTTTESH